MPGVVGKIKPVACHACYRFRDTVAGYFGPLPARRQPLAAGGRIWNPPLAELLLLRSLLSFLLTSLLCSFSLLSHNVLLWVVVRGLHGRRGKTPRGYCFRKIEKTAMGCLFLTSRERGHLGEPGNRFPEGRFVPMLLIIDCSKRKSRSIQNCRIPLPKRLRSDCRRCSASRSFATSSSTLIRATSYLALTAMLDNSQPCLAHANSVSSYKCKYDSRKLQTLFTKFSC